MTFPAGKTVWLIAVIVIVLGTSQVAAAVSQNTVRVMVTDLRTGENLEGAMVYYDGGYYGVTSGSEGNASLTIPYVTPGNHTVRTTLPGYTESSVMFTFPNTTMVTILLTKDPLVLLNRGGPSPHGINIVFYPSSTSYNCHSHEKIFLPDYIRNETRFREDVMTVINLTYLNLDQITSPSDPLPRDFRNVFNLYYYYDPSSPADAFSGCAGSIPARYWETVTFSDITVILYPTYYGAYANASCQPTGCSQDLGPGHTVMKAPADHQTVMRHETGHAVFELVDSYCGSTSYYQNNPYPNIWSSQESCQADARSTGRDPAQCRQIRTVTGASVTCSRNFWQWDPQPDIMAGVPGGVFGAASTKRITYILNGLNGGLS